MKQFGVAALALAIAGCGSSNGEAAMQNVSLSFAAMVGDVEFECGGVYESLGSDSTTLTLEDFRFYVQDVELQNTSGEWVAVELEDNQFQVENIALLDFEDGCGEVGTENLNDVVVGVVPAAEYEGLRFKVGLPEELNHADASTAAGVLNITALFWNWRGGYKFIRIDSGNIMNNPTVWRMHLGSTGCGSMDDLTSPPEPGSPCTNPNRVEVELDGFDPDANTVIADFQDLVEGAPLSTVTEGTPAGCMSEPNNADCGSLFGNLGLPFGEDPGGTQTFFSMD